jgi:hypothetical protein
MRQLSLLFGSVIAFFIMLSFFLMSKTSSIEHSIPINPENLRTEVSKQADELAQQAAETNLKIIDTGLRYANKINPVSPALTKGHVIMPHLGNETIKYVASKHLWGVNFVGQNLEEQVGSYFILFLLDSLKSQQWMNGKH